MNPFEELVQRLLRDTEWIIRGEELLTRAKAIASTSEGYVLQLLQTTRTDETSDHDGSSGEGPSGPSMPGRSTLE